MYSSSRTTTRSRRCCSGRCAWRATTCGSPSDGLTALDEAHAFLPDLVILDLGLPKLDGIEVAKTLRETDDVPILVLTARDAVESRVEGLDAGADDYLVKPFERQELLARLAGAATSPAAARTGGDLQCRRPEAQPRHP